ncbi:MAG TPA: bifunctional phosphoribosylaminoimidazolecarboxamide formyltransferase/IMP cyclohydrolase [archaeon]|nr:bifunctional phosphoribosylaminoimidazolecarboxamide formyltransferase/IMP cyclohydrolase [archaeon]
MKIKTALISVSDKTGIVDFAKELSKNGVKIISSGGTFAALEKAGIPCTKVEDVTGFPEMLEGRLKTLHPKLHGGILAKRNKDHLGQLKAQGIEQIDLVVVNLYPFKDTVLKGSKIDEAIENIDIGGPALIRAAAKNFESVGVIVDPTQYPKVLEDLKANKFELSEKMKKELCIEAFEHTAFYDSLVCAHLRREFNGDQFPSKLTLGFEKLQSLRYGENPHQLAVLYKNPLLANGSLIQTRQLNGKELSFNNYLDANAAIQIVREFDEPCAAIIKHANPCGVAIAKDISEAFKKAFECDSTSAFGGIIALNKKCDLKTAKQITSFFNEVVIAPAYEKDALTELCTKKNLRVLELKVEKTKDQMDYKYIEGGLLAQLADSTNESEWKNASGIKAQKDSFSDLKFANKVAAHVKSNAIVIAKNGATIGIGGGLTSRIDATELAIKKAAKNAKGASLASDGFFPFKDSIQTAASAGIIAIVEPGGSLKDEEVVAFAKEKSIALYFSGIRHFKH